MRVIAVSERTKSDVISLLGIPADRVSVVPLGPPADANPLPREEREAALASYGLKDRSYALFVGEVAGRKNPVRLAEAFARIATTHPETRLVYAGSPGIGYGELEIAIERFGISTRVDLLGHIPRRDVLALLSGAAVFVLPSRDEGFGIPALEAMRCGAPVIVSDGGALPEVVGDAGIIVPNAETEALAAAIDRVLADSALQQSLILRGLERAALFSWDEAARKTSAVYDEVLHEPSAISVSRRLEARA
jgi:glycosyltransferase involved in cell wall biosynthesis